MENCQKNGKELVDEIILWISKKKISVIPAPISLESFAPDYYTSDQSRMLIKKGFNPKMRLYRENDQTRALDISDWTTKLGGDFTNLSDNFWFCVKKSECEKNCSKGCKDQIEKFVYGNGNRTPKNVPLGKGGFGKVFLGKIHEIEVGAKFIDVTEKYKKLIGTGTYSIRDVISGLLEDVAFEATLQSGFGHPNILEARDFWIQCSGLDVINPTNDQPIIELVIATKKCSKNLQEWVETEQFNFSQLKQFLIGVTDGLAYLENQNLSHRDVKPANILITDRQNPVAVLTDFGLVKSDGITPGYAAPERFIQNGTVLAKSDIFSLGVTLLNCFFDSDVVLVILFGTVKTLPPFLVNSAASHQILSLVKKMIDFDPTKRPTFASIKTDLTNLQSYRRTTISNLNLPSIAKPGHQSRQLSFGMKTVSIIQKPIQISANIHTSMISGWIHDQKDSYLCWAFAVCTVIRTELKRIIITLYEKKIIDDQFKKQILFQIDQTNKEARLLFELVSLVNPRSPQLEDFRQNREKFQSASSETVMERICYDGLLRPAGWTRMTPFFRSTYFLDRIAARR